MGCFLGVDTSNYTTSLALSEEGRITRNLRRLLTVAPGQRGLRQSDAVFAHTVNLPSLFAELGRAELTAVGASAFPRDAEGSYMPCFLAGLSAASAVAATRGLPLYRFSHQAGHIAAALFSCGQEALIGGRFLALHLSGGTTELVAVDRMRIALLGGTRDISAGKAIDRIGVRLGLDFPCGKALEELAGDAVGTLKAGKLSVNGFDCNLSGLENRAEAMISTGADGQTVAAFVLTFIAETVSAMIGNAVAAFPGLPIVCSGGVMSNRYLRRTLQRRFGGFYAEPEYACDNAAGIARLAELRFYGEIGTEGNHAG